MLINVKRRVAKINSRGERVSICRTPLLQWNTFPGVPLRREEVTELVHDQVHLGYPFGSKVHIDETVLAWL